MQQEPGAPSAWRGKRAIPYALAVIAMVLTYINIDSLAPVIPDVKAGLGLSAAGAGLVYSLLFTGRMTGNFPAAYLLGRRGAAFTALVGGLTLMAGSLLAWAASGQGLLLAGRLVQGVGIALLVNAGLRSILLAKPGDGAAMTWFGVAATTGGIIGIQSGGLLSSHLGWRSVFLFGAVLAVAITLIAAWSQFAPAKQRERVVVEPVAEVPLDLRRVLLPAAMLVLVFFNYGLWVLLPIYTDRTMDATTQQNARLLMTISAAHLASAFPAGRLIGRFGASTMLAPGLVITAIGSIGVVLAPNLWLVGVALVPYSFGSVMAGNAAGDLILQRGGRSGKAVGAVRIASDIGMAIGPWAAGAVADAFGIGAPFRVFATLEVTVAIVLVIALRAFPKLSESSPPVALSYASPERIAPDGGAGIDDERER